MLINQGFWVRILLLVKNDVDGTWKVCIPNWVYDISEHLSEAPYNTTILFFKHKSCNTSEQGFRIDHVFFAIPIRITSQDAGPRHVPLQQVVYLQVVSGNLPRLVVFTSMR